MTRKTYYLPIDGAVSFAEMKIDGDKVYIPEMNEDYKHCIIIDGNVHVSKDGNLYSAAASVKIGDDEINRKTILKILEDFRVL